MLSALAMYKVFSLADKAKPLVVEPVSLVGNKAVAKVSITLLVLVLITETELSLALATYKMLPFLFSSNSFGWLSVLMVAANASFTASKTATLSLPHKETYSVFSSGDKTQL